MYYLRPGNSKLGKGIFQFSIPAGSSCPGKSTICDKECYAQHGFFLMKNVHESLVRNFEATKTRVFVFNMIEDIEEAKAKVVRIHVAGDFYNVDYACKWLRIIKSCPDVTFLTYTRSWRLNKIVTVLEKMAEEPNVKLWYSVDDETGLPLVKPDNVRYAYMMTDNAPEIDISKCDLVFRDKPLLNTVAKYIDGTVVCPVENGTGMRLTCDRCGICWKDKETPSRKRQKWQLVM